MPTVKVLDLFVEPNESLLKGNSYVDVQVRRGFLTSLELPVHLLHRHDVDIAWEHTALNVALILDHFSVSVSDAWSKFNLYPGLVVAKKTLVDATEHVHLPLSLQPVTITVRTPASSTQYLPLKGDVLFHTGKHFLQCQGDREFEGGNFPAMANECLPPCEAVIVLGPGTSCLS